MLLVLQAVPSAQATVAALLVGHSPAFDTISNQNVTYEQYIPPRVVQRCSAAYGQNQRLSWRVTSRGIATRRRASSADEHALTLLHITKRSSASSQVARASALVVLLACGWLGCGLSRYCCCCCWTVGAGLSMLYVRSEIRLILKSVGSC